MSRQYALRSTTHIIQITDTYILTFSGVAFRGLKGKKLYPIISAVWGHCEITMTYLNGLHRMCISPPSSHLIGYISPHLTVQLGHSLLWNSAVRISGARWDRTTCRSSTSCPSRSAYATTSFSSEGCTYSCVPARCSPHGSV